MVIALADGAKTGVTAIITTAVRIKKSRIAFARFRMRASPNRSFGQNERLSVQGPVLSAKEAKPGLVEMAATTP
jgi:hypothetical protein